MQIGKIDFGPLDARHAATESQFDEALFSKVFIDPVGIDINDLKRGKKYFVYGIKGSGKSAILKYLDIQLRRQAETRFVYFSDSVREQGNAAGSNVPVGTDEVTAVHHPDEYWRSFFFVLIAKVMYESSIANNKKFLNLVRSKATGAPGGLLEKVMKSAPSLSAWSSEIGGRPSLKVEGEFSEIVTVEQFFSTAMGTLAEKKLQRKLYIFVDELEIVFKAEEQFEKDVALAESLVRVIRDLNEQFRKRQVDVCIFCAVRREISDRILGGDASKIIADLGQEVAWERPSWAHEDPNYIHPLFEIALRRIFFSENPGRSSFPLEERERVIRQYFPFFSYGGPSKKGTQGQILDLTTYRPRDISILFNAAQRLDKNRESFQRETFVRLIRKPLKDALWRDFTEALRSEFSQSQLVLLGKILDRLPQRFSFADFMQAVDDFSGDPEISFMLDNYKEFDWSNILKELYKLGAVGNVEPGEHIEERFKFHFRGYTSGLIIAKGVDIVKQKALVEA